jgi:CelD/BcsL family acetyltransferase involved in cellulose biosynthesis
LRDAGVARVASLRAGPTLVASDICLVHDGRVSGWIASYDDAFAAFSPGRLLLEHLIETTFTDGHREFDFLVGNERYKWVYATHTRLIGPVGTPPRLPTAVMALRKRMRLGVRYRRLRRALER